MNDEYGIWVDYPDGKSLWLEETTGNRVMTFATLGAAQAQVYNMNQIHLKNEFTFTAMKFETDEPTKGRRAK